MKVEIKFHLECKLHNDDDDDDGDGGGDGDGDGGGDGDDDGDDGDDDDHAHDVLMMMTMMVMMMVTRMTMTRMTMTMIDNGGESDLNGLHLPLTVFRSFSWRDNQETYSEAEHQETMHPNQRRTRRKRNVPLWRHDGEATSRKEDPALSQVPWQF